jgi:hypothetical protein
MIGAAKNPLTGITAAECAPACNREQCVISKRPFCFHPLKGGQTFAFTDPAVRSAYAEACTVLGVKNVHQLETGNEVS